MLTIKKVDGVQEIWYQNKLCFLVEKPVSPAFSVGPCMTDMSLQIQRWFNCQINYYDSQEGLTLLCEMRLLLDEYPLEDKNCKSLSEYIEHTKERIATFKEFVECFGKNL